MALSRIDYPGDGVTTQFSIPFALGYISRDEVTARVGEESDGSGQPIYRTITWISDTFVEISGNPAPIGSRTRFERTMPRTELIVDFEDGAVLNEENLNTAQKQSIMLVHEILDGRFSSVFTDDIDMGGNRIKNVAPAQELTDAVNLEQVLEIATGGTIDLTVPDGSITEPKHATGGVSNRALANGVVNYPKTDGSFGIVFNTRTDATNWVGSNPMPATIRLVGRDYTNDRQGGVYLRDHDSTDNFTINGVTYGRITKDVSATTQSLTLNEKGQARTNIGAVGFEPQSLTNNQRETARANIGLVGKGAIIKPPADFGWPGVGSTFIGRYPLYVVRRPDGFYEMPFTLEVAPTLIENTGTTYTYYVATYGNGSDSNAGTSPNTPLATIDAALAKPGCRRIVLQPGLHVNSWTQTPNSSQTYITVDAGGYATHVTGVIPTSWTQVGSSRIYSANVGASPVVVNVITDRYQDEFGFALALPKYETLEDLQSTVNPGWAHVGSTMYVRLPNTGAVTTPSGGEVVCVTRGEPPKIRFNGSISNRYKVERIKFYGSDWGLQINGPEGSFNGTQFVHLKDCHFAYAYADGLGVWNSRGGVLVERCYAYKNRLDGFNWHNTLASNPCLGIEYYCYGIGNGWQNPGSANQGSTNHDWSLVARIGGGYGWSGGGGSIVDINDSKSWNIGLALYGSDAPSESSRNGFETQGNAQAWLEDVQIFDSPTAIRARGNSRVYTRDIRYSGTLMEQETGLILPY